MEQTGATPPRSHDLIALGRRTGASSEIAETLEQLNPTYAVSRYPDVLTDTIPADFVSEEVARSHIADAEAIMRWVRQKLQIQS